MRSSTATEGRMAGLGHNQTNSTMVAGRVRLRRKFTSSRHDESFAPKVLLLIRRRWMDRAVNDFTLVHLYQQYDLKGHN